jgi:hypothetical protein
MLELSKVGGFQAKLTEFEKMASFTNGLSQKLQERVLYRQPQSFTEILEIVTSQAQTQELLRSVPQAMEVDVVKEASGNEAESSEEEEDLPEERELAAFFRWRRKQQALAQADRSQLDKRKANGSGKVTCWVCGKAGHISRDCKVKKGFGALQKDRDSRKDGKQALRGSSQKQPKGKGKEKGKSSNSKLNQVNCESSSSGEEL